MAAPGKASEMEKSKKYDRQLRLWGDHGQAALESSQVCLINATATGTEVLKGIVLPGIGAFTIVDGNKITGEDVGNNFFLDKDSIGKSRAQVATQLLLELNSDVRGDFVDETPEQLLSNNPVFFNHFSVVIATKLNERTLIDLAEKLWEANVPLVICRTYGFIGYIRLQTKEHTVVESHPDNAHEDLRLDRPFPGLAEYASTVDLSKMTKKDHSHTPYIVIILKYLEIWKSLHNGQLPKTYKEKDEFKTLIKTGIIKNELGFPEEEENFDEALKAVNSVLSSTQLPTTIKEILEDELCTNLTSESRPFWIMAHAVKDFIENEGNGALPVRGTIPDMTADSERYVKIQTIYRQQAYTDLEIVFKKVQQLLQQLGKPQDCISEVDVKQFCKNAAFLKVIKGRSLAEEYNIKTAKIQDIVMHLDNPDSEMVFYVLLRAVDRFYLEYNRYPGYFNDQVEPDIVKLKSCLCRLLQEWGCGPMAKDDFVHEICRYGAAELHAVAAFIGGCAAHEIIKLVTNQYVPMNNTYIYNAMSATSSTFEL